MEPEPLLSEVQNAIRVLKLGKSAGTDAVTAELIKSAGEKGEIFPIPKKGDTLQCSKNRTIALISHNSKILLRIIANRMEEKLNIEIAEQAGFKQSTGTRNQILTLKMVIEKSRENSKDLYLCFIDYTKAFDMVIHELLWKDMQSMGFPEHIILLLKSMYDE